MKKVLIAVAFCVLTLLIFGSCSNDNNSSQQQPEQQNNNSVSQQNALNEEAVTATSVFGEFVSKDLKGNVVDASVFAENKLTMVNMWATFCGPCINEMPDLGELAQEYSDKGVGIVGIPIDITDESGNIDDYLFNDAVEIVEQTKADYVHIVPTAEMFSKKLAAVYTVPETIFVDSEGNQVGESYLGARSKEQWIDIIEELLGEMQ